MELTARQQDIVNAKICPYCGSTTKVVSEEFVYGRSYRNRSMVVCNRFPECSSYVGCHDNGEPLGRLADKRLRHFKKMAHDSFDRIWREKHMERTQAYEWLADELELPDKFTHIGFFGISTCKKVIDICDKYLNEQAVKNT